MKLEIRSKHDKANESDGVANTLYIMAFVIWIVGGIGGIATMERAFNIGLIILGSSIISGIFVYAFAHMIKLLHKISVHEYEIDIPDNLIADAIKENLSSTQKMNPKSAVVEGTSQPDTGVDDSIATEKMTLNKANIPIRIIPEEDGTLKCHVCGKINQWNSKKCDNCGQLFVNNHEEIPYWCGNCGQPGPYEKECPVCESNFKMFNY